MENQEQQTTNLAIRGEVTLETLDAALEREMQSATEGINFRPPIIKVSREMPVFMMADGSTVETLEGTMMHHHKARGYWETEGEKIPTCSSLDGVIGIDQDGNKKPCATCEFGGEGAWGTGKDGRGKACKEMRWIYFKTDEDRLPGKISLSPKSLGPFDSVISTMVNKKGSLPPIARRVQIGLDKAESNGYKFSVFSKDKFKVLGDVPREELVELINMKSSVVAAAHKVGVLADDYETGDAVDGGGENQPY